MEEDKKEIFHRILNILIKTKEDILSKAFFDLGWDAAYFDVNIDLKIKVDDQIIRIKDSWNKLSE